MSDAYRDYLQKYCRCKSPICKVISVTNKSEEPKFVHVMNKFVSADQTDIIDFKKRLRALSKDLAKCDHLVTSKEA